MADPSIIIDFEPDWTDPPEVSYAFATALQPTPYFVEQRRPLLQELNRSMKCKYLLDGERLQLARNLFSYSKSRFCGIPIYSEPIFSASISSSSTSIVATNSLDYYWNIKNCSHAILYDLVTGASLLLKVASVSGQTIFLSAAITGSWTPSQCVIYPAFKGFISSLEDLSKTGSIGEVSVDFEEAEETAEATEEAIADEARACCLSGSVEAWSAVNLTAAPLYKYDPSGIMALSASAARATLPANDGSHNYFCQGRTQSPYLELGPVAEFRFKISIISLGSGLTPFPGTYLEFNGITFTDNVVWQNVSVGASIYADRLLFIVDGAGGPAYSSYINFPLPIHRWFHAIWDGWRPRVLIYRNADFTDFQEELHPYNTGHALNPTLYALSFCTVNSPYVVTPSMVAEVSGIQWRLYTGS